MSFRIRAVLVASDLSESSSVVVRTAGALASLAEAELHLVHAVEPDAESEEEGARELERAHAALRVHLRGSLPPTLRVTSSRVEPGTAPEVILRRAAEVNADLLVIGPHRRKAATGEPLGTTADHLVRHTDVPCLIIREPLSLPLRRILVPTDLSEAAAGALDVAYIWGSALRMPRTSGEETRLDIVHCLEARSAGGGAEGGAVQEEIEIERRLREQITAAEARSGSGGLMRVGTAMIHGGDPADEILRFGQENRVDLVVLGTHGQSALTRADVGSVSSAVARRAIRPVLLVPPGLWKG